jgi:hypothetical protein
MKVRHGLKNICTDGKKWYYLLFYDIDSKKLHEGSHQDLDSLNISYMVYKTLNGFHFIGLTPLSVTQWSELFLKMNQWYSSYYSGHIIRIDLKDGETQELLALNQDHEVIPNLFNVWAHRFGLQKMDAGAFPYKYRLVFEDYRSMNE